MSEREPGWFWVRWTPTLKWSPAEWHFDGARWHWETDTRVFGDGPAVIGPRIEPPEVSNGNV